ncbi:3-deoxy-7-phosphoheptulonate synthase [candidate division CSSED10-310 bacterium]|uniref:3-deoxy-7-phosphoheptulonate synthase n=1 Tax=candidate division CSSED10-310 bacterium TaxID=2855610 RepID=A0ABV6YTX4_UNCC1
MIQNNTDHNHESIVKKKVTINELTIGDDSVVVMAGPCSIESRAQINSIAQIVKDNGAQILRGGAFKPRTSPYSFQGLGEEGLEYLAEAGQKHGLLTITEVMDSSDIPLVCEYADILQIGTRNMFNYSLLKKLGKIDKPVMLKRSFMATIEEFLLAAEYVLVGGNEKIILCERGIRTFVKFTRNTLDISAIPIITKLKGYPVIVDPCHAAGRSDILVPLSRASIAAGCDGLMLEVHPNPQKAKSDGLQSLNFTQFTKAMTSIQRAIQFMREEKACE